MLAQTFANFRLYNRNCDDHRSDNFEIYFGVFNSPKNERKQFNLRYHSNKVEFFRSIFVRIEDTKNIFRN